MSHFIKMYYKMTFIAKFSFIKNSFFYLNYPVKSGFFIMWDILAHYIYRDNIIIVFT